MDGVLISSREAIAAAWSRVAGEQGVALGLTACATTCTVARAATP